MLILTVESVKSIEVSIRKDHRFIAQLISLSDAGILVRFAFVIHLVMLIFALIFNLTHII